jgi:S-adenosylmethionine decarboxylase
MQGLHLTADLHRCRCDSHWLLDAQALGRACVDAVNVAGLQAVAELFHTFPTTGHGPRWRDGHGAAGRKPPLRAHLA